MREVILLLIDNTKRCCDDLLPNITNVMHQLTSLAAMLLKINEDDATWVDLKENRQFHFLFRGIEKLNSTLRASVEIDTICPLVVLIPRKLPRRKIN